MIHTRGCAPHPIPSSKLSYRWGVTVGMLIIATIAWGIAFYGLGFYLNKLHHIRGWTVTELSLVTFLFNAVAACLAIQASKIVVSLGPRVVFVVGGLMLGTGLVLIGQSEQFWHVILAYLVMAVGWAATGLAPITATVISLFPDDSARPLTLALTGASLGGIVVVPALAELTNVYGFELAANVVGASASLIVVGVGLFMRGLEDRKASISNGTSISSAAPTTNGPLRTSEFWILFVSFGAALTVQVGFLVHQLSILEFVYSPTSAAKVVAATTAAGLAGRVMFASIVRPSNHTMLTVVFLMIQTAAMAVAAGGVESEHLLLISSIIFGLGVGVLVTVPPLLTRHTFPKEPISRVFPLVNLAIQGGIAIGPPVVAVLESALGGYGRALAILAVLDGTAAVLLTVSFIGLRKSAITSIRRSITAGCTE